MCVDYDLIIEMPVHPKAKVQEDWLWEHLRAHTINRDEDAPDILVYIFVTDRKRTYKVPPRIDAKFSHHDVPSPHQVKLTSIVTWPMEIECVRCSKRGILLTDGDADAPKVWTCDGVCAPANATLDLNRVWYVTSHEVRWY